MKIFGFEITRRKAVPTMLQGVESQRGWWPIIRESFSGAWQRNVEITVDNITSHPTVFACASLIASDISKMHIRLVQQDADGIWNETSSPAFTPVLRKPNHFQTRIQFFESWVLSKLLHGNTYAIKERDERDVVVRLYVLDPCRVRPLVAPDGSVFYALKTDNLSGLPDELVVPASEIIHDRFNTKFHPLVGLSPLYACGLAALQGIKIQQNSTDFFANGSQPGGVLTHPGAPKQEAVDRLKEKWDSGFTGPNRGKVAVLSGGMTYQPLAESASDSQLVEQLEWVSKVIASVFHVPFFLVGGPYPTYNNVQALTAQYYTQCIQVLAEAIEECLDEGLGMRSGDVASKRYGTEFNVDDLLRMDTATQMESLDKGKNYLTPNEGRFRLNLRPVTGGDTVYRQQQDFSIEALNKRDQKDDPFAKESTQVSAAPAQASEGAKILPFRKNLEAELAESLKEIAASNARVELAAVNA